MGVSQEADDLYDATVSSFSKEYWRIWQAELGDGAWRALKEKGVQPEDLLWLVPAREVRTATGDVLSSAFLAMDKGLRLHAFRFGTWRGLFFVLGVVQSVPFSVSLEGSRIEVVAQFPLAAGVVRCVVDIAGATPGKLGPSWPAVFRTAIAKKMGISPNVPMAVGSLKRLALRENCFGTKVVRDDLETVIAFSEGHLWSLHSDALDYFSEVLQWWWNGHELEMLQRCGKELSVLRIREQEGSLGCRQTVLQSFLATLPADCRVSASPSSTVSSWGVFSLRCEGAGTFEKWVLAKEARSVAVLDNDLRVKTSATHYFADDEMVLLSSLGGAGALVQLEKKKTSQEAESRDEATRDAAAEFAMLTPLDALFRHDDGTLWCPVISEEEGETLAPACFVLRGQDCDLGEEKGVPLVLADSVEVRSENVQLSRVILPQAPGRKTNRMVMRVPHLLAYRIWEEYDAACMEQRLATTEMAELYRMRNEAWRQSVLTALFCDLLILGRTMNKGVSIDQAMAQMGSDSEINIKDSSLKQAMVEKILLLMLQVSRLKQKLELLLATYPYHWADQESQWLTNVFGDAAQAEARSSRKRLVPVVRRQIREVAATVSRSVGEIEAAARPVDALLSREGLNNILPARLGRYAPQLIQVGSFLAMAVLGVDTSAMYLMTSIGAGSLSGYCRQLTSNAEASSQIIRAARNILPWWSILSRTLTVSIYETSQFVNELNVQAMKRDRALLERLPAAERSAAVRRLAAQLRSDISRNRRGYFAEMFDGSGVRAINLIREIEETVTQKMRNDLSCPTSISIQDGWRPATKGTP